MREHLIFVKRLSSQCPIPNSPFPKIVKFLALFKIEMHPIDDSNAADVIKLTRGEVKKGIWQVKLGTKKEIKAVD